MMEVGSWESEVGSQKSEVGSQKSGVGTFIREHLCHSCPKDERT